MRIQSAAWGVCVGVSILLVAADAARAQGRAAADARAGKTAAVVELRDLEGIGPRAKVRTPEYQVGYSGRVPPREWCRLAVSYDTAADWLDELTFQFYALVLKEQSGKKDFSLFRGSVTYIDVAKGRRHAGEMFIRPGALARFGEVVAVAVEVFHKGEMVASKADAAPGLGNVPQDPKDWGKNPMIVMRDGYLLNRSQTPFAFVSYDDFETVK